MRVVVLNQQQLTNYAQQAGFQGQALQDIVAIAMAESGGNTNAYNGNDPNGGSFGILQINGIHFGTGTSQSCAFDPACSFRFAYQLSGGGNNLQPWSTYTSGFYKKFLGGITSVSSQAWYNYTPVFDFGKTFSWATYPVQGEDIPMPMDTPITALFPGTVANQYYNAGGGEVVIQADDPSQLRGIPYYYFVHLDQIMTSLGQHVTTGQQVGLSGGQNVGGQHPSAPNYSSGPHLELGLSKSKDIPYTLATITPDLNPDWLLTYAQNTNLSSTGSPCKCPPGYHAIVGPVSSVCENDTNPNDIKLCTGAVTDPIAQISNFIASLSKLQEWLSDPVRIIKLVAGFLLIGGAILLLVNPSSQLLGSVIKSIKQAVPNPQKSFEKGTK
jgi:murein DD-endopeptidase MepM/ murein hydrolase activator NlpD